MSCDCLLTVCSVWINPCPNGLPVMGPNNRPQTCNPKGEASSCPLSYYCLAGASTETTVCCQGGNFFICLPCGIEVSDIFHLGRSGGCEEPQNQGQGDYALPRWYFDANDRSCKQFSYRGLRGNQNNFLNREDCIKSCPVFINPCPDVGLMNPSQISYCNPNSPNSCSNNQWCHAGADRDTTLCCPNGMWAIRFQLTMFYLGLNYWWKFSAADPCTQPQVRGTGAASLPRFYYDSNVRQCFGFMYSGLGGNQNNFMSQSQCEARCPGIYSR